tara:strand:- start:940 stop:1251 length:312 start_codon:yes stop_codon:yes gene_type:complete
MVKKLGIITATFVLVMFSCSCASFAQIACGPRDNMVKHLATKYLEKQVAMGLNVQGDLVEIFSSDKGDFTILLSKPNGTSCVATTGHNWTTSDFPEKVPEHGT